MSCTSRRHCTLSVHFLQAFQPCGDSLQSTLGIADTTLPSIGLQTPSSCNVLQAGRQCMHFNAASIHREHSQDALQLMGIVSLVKILCCKHLPSGSYCTCQCFLCSMYIDQCACTHADTPSAASLYSATASSRSTSQPQPSSLHWASLYVASGINC